MTRLVNGLVPHFFDGELTGGIWVNGIDMKNCEIADIAGTVGSAFQNPRSQFFCVDVAGEVAFGCEKLGLPEDEIVARVTSSASEMGIEGLMGRSIFDLSGGEKQKVAFASVSAMMPDVFVLDEPTSNLDTKAIDNLRHIVENWKRQGKAIIVAEHRLHWLSEVCDRVVYLEARAIKYDIPMTELRTYRWKSLPRSAYGRCGSMR